MSQVMWTEKHRPKEENEVVGNRRAKQQFLDWMRRWRPGAGAALLYGPPGVGKTALVHAAARQFGYELIEMNASDARTKDKIMRIVGRAATEASLPVVMGNVRGTIILLDEVDGVFPGRDADIGGIEAINYVIRYARNPVVLVANCPWEDKLRPLRNVCEMIRFRRVSARDVITLLRRICQREGIAVEGKALRKIAERCCGDVRSAINDLQALAEGRTELKVSDVLLAYRDRQRNVFETLEAFFNASSAVEAREALDSSELDVEELIDCICENIPRKMADARSCAEAYEALAKADLMRARLRRSGKWGLLKHVVNLLAQVPLAGNRRFEFVKFQYPPLRRLALDVAELAVTMPSDLRRLALSRAKIAKTLLQSICEKVKKYCHVSRKVASWEYIPMLKTIFQYDPVQAKLIAEELRLTIDEEKFLQEFD